MRFSLLNLFTLLSLPLSIMAQQGDRNATNNMGSMPNQRFQLNQAQALQILHGAAAQSANINIPVNIAVTDTEGFLLAFLRIDNAFLGSIDISIKKARTVALFNGAVTTAQWYDQVQPGAPLYGIEQTNGGLIAFGGGVPVYRNGYFVGAVGVSGGTTDQDVEIATAGVVTVGSVE